MRDDAERLRLSHAGRDAFEPDRPGDGASRFVGRVRSTSPNINVGKFLLVRPESALGTEAENQAGSFADLGTTDVPALLLGPGLPAPGDRLVVRSVADRLVVKRKSSGGSGGTGTLPGCTCAHPPAVLTMTVATCTDARFNACTIQWGATPSSLSALSLGAECYLSTTTFNDPQTGDAYYYHLSCFASVVRLGRVFPTSAFGSPFLDPVIFYWSIGFPGNTCSPFSLTNGTVFAGGDPNCDVDITG